MTTRLGIIGGSGLSRSGAFGGSEGEEVDTPHGPPSSRVEAGERIAFLARHGSEHQIPPHRINHQANLWALKETGVSAVVGSCSVGSLQAEIAPGTLVVPDDYVSFWDVPAYFDDQVQHITPSLDQGLRQQLVETGKVRGVPVQDGGVYVQTRGPRLETKAEVRILREFGDLLGMTMATEATLAQELGLRYASLCSVDNYGHGITKEPPTFEDIRRTQEMNARVVRGVLQGLAERME